MTETYSVAFEFAHGKLYCASDPYGPKVDRPLPNPDEASLARALEEFRPGINRITLVQLDCPDANLTDQERTWRSISAASLQQRLGIPVRHRTDISLLVQGLAAQEDAVQFPYGVLILHDSDTNDDSCAGYARKYRVTDRKHRKTMSFTVQGNETTLAAVSAAGAPLSQSSPGVQEVIATFMTDHPDIRRLVVWSPDDLPFRRATYNEPRENGESCRVTMLSDHTFVLSTALRQA